MGKPLDKLDAELLILTHPDISQVASKAQADFLYEKLNTKRQDYTRQTAKTAVKLQIIALIKELALGITPVRRFPLDFGLEIFVRGYALPQADVNVLS